MLRGASRRENELYADGKASMVFKSLLWAIGVVGAPSRTPVRWNLHHISSSSAAYFDIVDCETRYNSGKYVALAHWIKRDHPTRLLFIGAARGRETLAALAFGAAHVDAVKMVCTVIEAGRGPYADFIGHIYLWHGSALRHQSDP